MSCCESGYVFCFRVATGNFVPEAVNAMDSSACVEKHKRTFTGDYFNAVHATKGNSLWTDRACANTAVHPDEADASPSAVGDDRFGDLRRSDQKSGFHWRGNLLDIGETGMSENIRRMRIYGNEVIAATEKFLE